MMMDNETLASLQDLELYKAAQVINLYLPPIIIILGCLVNVLSILVMRSHYFRNVSTSIYMTAGAINDSTSLLVALLPHWLFVNYPYVYNRTDSSDDMCKFFNFYGFSNTDFTMILTACMTADRAYAIKFPLRVATADMVKRAKIMIVVGAVVVGIKNFHLWFCSVMSPPESKERLCSVKATGDSFQFFVQEVSLGEKS
ncbi:hypothetical protein BaRGS_00022684 [Batillaria attramentaria]|uniref:G-protein coupled receptors family 1 profile domain-containing protein n=1 Tax=Batillaria attramentaria TaxID=370345 RepID=A0ABD0KFX8_9CAEN